MSERVDRLEQTIDGIKATIDKLWSARRSDKRAAREDNERRHAELMAQLSAINGKVRDHRERIVAIETRHSERDRADDAARAYPASGGDDSHDLRKLAAIAGATGGGLPAAIVLLYMLWQMLGGGG